MKLNFHIQDNIHLKTRFNDKKTFRTSVEYLNIPEDYEDFVYNVSEGLTTITGYIGKKKLLEIPPYLGDGATAIIDKTAFTESEITGVWIPEGVVEIR